MNSLMPLALPRAGVGKIKSDAVKEKVSRCFDGLGHRIR
jgi:hypothetical protein